jgi:hypothetical protein
VTAVGADTIGAVNKPDEVIVPAVAAQVTVALEALLTMAGNCWVALEAMVAVDGEVATLTARAMAKLWSTPIASTASESRDRTRKWYAVPGTSPTRGTEWAVTWAAARVVVLPYATVGPNSNCESDGTAVVQVTFAVLPIAAICTPKVRTIHQPNSYLPARRR